MSLNRANCQVMRTTQIFYADKYPAKVEEVINSELAKIDQWCEVNKMQRNLSQYQAIVMGKLKASIEFRCENTTIPKLRGNRTTRDNYG